MEYIRSTTGMLIQLAWSIDPKNKWILSYKNIRIVKVIVRGKILEMAKPLKIRPITE
jgi:hypothetical protein